MRITNASKTLILPIIAHTCASDHTISLLHCAGHVGVAGKHLTAMESTQISSGIVINATDQHGKTALHLAANSGQISAVNYLLEHKADVTASDNSGSTPLHVAAAAGFAHICAKLIEAGAEVDAMDSHGHSPMMVSTTHAVTAVLRGQQFKEGEDTSPKAN